MGVKYSQELIWLQNWSKNRYRITPVLELFGTPKLQLPLRSKFDSRNKAQLTLHTMKTPVKNKQKFLNKDKKR